MSEIKLLNIDELERIIPFAAEFISESGEDIPFNENHFKKTWKELYEVDTGRIIIAEKEGVVVGVLGFIVYNDLLCGELRSSETFWFVRKADRGIGLKLLDAFEDLSKEMGVKNILMMHLKRLMPEKLKSIYLKRGYREIETQYIKGL